MRASLSIRVGLAALMMLAAPALRAEIVEVGNDELRALLAQGTPLIDLRTVGEWRQTGVIEGSQLIMLFDERGGADPAAWLRNADAVADPSRPVILICRSGNRSGKAARLMQEKSPSRTIYNVRDGIISWARAGLPLVSATDNLKHPGTR